MSASTSSVTLLIPTLNEEIGMKEIMPRINPEWVDQILILDGGSTDGTISYSEEHGYDVVIQAEPGLINAYRQVFPHIKGDIVITFSPDGNSVPELIPGLLEEMRKGSDMVIVSRYLGDATSEDDTKITGWGNALFTWLINTLFGGQYTDAMVIYRAYRKELIVSLGLLSDPPISVERFFRNTISWEPLLSMRAAKARLRISEIPGDEPPRIGGAGKCRHFFWGFLYLLEMLQERVFWRIRPS